jgi:hypothetical protein
MVKRELVDFTLTQETYEKEWKGVRGCEKSHSRGLCQGIPGVVLVLLKVCCNCWQICRENPEIQNALNISDVWVVCKCTSYTANDNNKLMISL